jgi:hypothetical protein
MWRICDVQLVWVADQHIERPLLSETSFSFIICHPPDIARQGSTTALTVSATFSSGGFQ